MTFTATDIDPAEQKPEDKDVGAGQEPSPRPADPSWKWSAYWQKAEDGINLRVFFWADRADGRPYLGEAGDLEDGVALSGPRRASVDEAVADAMFMARLVWLYKLDRFLCHPLPLGDLARPLPPDPSSLGPAFSERLAGAERILDSQGGVAAGEYVAQLAYSQGSSRFEPTQLVALVACLCAVAERRGYRIAQGSKGADGPLSS